MFNTAYQHQVIPLKMLRKISVKMRDVTFNAITVMLLFTFVCKSFVLIERACVGSLT